MKRLLTQSKLNSSFGTVLGGSTGVTPTLCGNTWWYYIEVQKQSPYSTLQYMSVNTKKEALIVVYSL